MRLLHSPARLLAPFSLLLATLGSAAGCTTEAACFDDCEGIPGGGTGGASNNGGSGGSLVIGFGGDSETGIGGTSISVGGGKLEDAGMPCDGIDFAMTSTTAVRAATSASSPALTRCASRASACWASVSTTATTSITTQQRLRVCVRAHGGLRRVVQLRRRRLRRRRRQRLRPDHRLTKLRRLRPGLRAVARGQHLPAQQRRPLVRGHLLRSGLPRRRRRRRQRL